MIKEMHGFKVIGENTRMSCRTDRWMQDSKWSVYYPVNVEVFPNVEGSKLFFFKNRADALKFCDFYDIVVPCIATNPTKVKWIAIIHSIYDDFANFWKLRRKIISKAKAPEGTWLADSITCLE